MAYFADIHVHATMRPFHQNQNPPASIWEDVTLAKNCQNLPLAAEIIGITNRLATFAQSNLRKAIDPATGLKVRVVFNTLYPVELNMYDLKGVADCVIPEEGEIKLGSCLSGFPQTTTKNAIDNVKQNQAVDYLDSAYGLKAEYAYLVNQQGVLCDNRYSIKIAEDYADFRNIIDNQPNKVAIINTIEGLHCFIQLAHYGDFLEPQHIEAVENPESDFFNQQLQNYRQGIQTVKAWGNGRHTPLFITFAHHFWNFMCGQAQSFEGGMKKLIIKQNEGLGKGFTALGRVVLKMLLDTQNGRRILIDTKHMSAKTRQEYYQILRERYPDNSVPVIASHTAVSGIENLSYYTNKIKEPPTNHKYFNPWSINICDEDIKMIHQTKGLIGLLFLPERLEGKEAERQRDKLPRGDSQVKELLRNFLAQAFHIVRVCNDISAWDLISVGSDFDGLVGYLRGIDTFKDYPKIETELLKLLENLQTVHYIGVTEHYPAFTTEKYQELMFGLTPREIMDKIMYQNVERFLHRYFNHKYLHEGVPNEDTFAL